MRGATRATLDALSESAFLADIAELAQKGLIRIEQDEAGEYRAVRIDIGHG